MFTLIDTGASVDMIDLNTFEKLNKKVLLQKFNRNLCVRTPNNFNTKIFNLRDGAGGNLRSTKIPQIFR